MHYTVYKVAIDRKTGKWYIDFDQAVAGPYEAQGLAVFAARHAAATTSNRGQPSKVQVYDEKGQIQNEIVFPHNPSKRAGQPKRITYYVVRRGGEWYLASDEDKSGVHYPTQKDAIEAARSTANFRMALGEKLKVKIQGEDGKFRDSETYGDDPRNIPG